MVALRIQTHEIEEAVRTGRCLVVRAATRQLTREPTRLAALRVAMPPGSLKIESVEKRPFNSIAEDEARATGLWYDGFRNAVTYDADNPWRNRVLRDYAAVHRDAFDGPAWFVWVTFTKRAPRLDEIDGEALAIATAGRAAEYARTFATDVLRGSTRGSFAITDEELADTDVARAVRALTRFAQHGDPLAHPVRETLRALALHTGAPVDVLVDAAEADPLTDLGCVVSAALKRERDTNP